MKLHKTRRARGSNRGDSGGGYERTNPDYEAEKLARLRRDYDGLAPQWRDAFLLGLSKWQREYVTNRRIPPPG